MRRLFRLFAIVSAAAIVMTGTVVGLTIVGSDLVHDSASAQELPLPPISSQLQEGSTVYADDGTTVLGVLKGAETRTPIPVSQVSKTMITAVLDTEDHGFYEHGGFDVSSIVRAFVNDAQGNSVQGGSTIPQQLVKQLYLTSVRTLNRKVREAVLADRLEQEYSKDQILQAYLNTVYLGNGVYGVQAAAELYFQRPAGALNLPQSALLAGMISDPNGYNPYLDGEAARQRRTEVLGRMAYYHDITPAQQEAAENTPLPTKAPVAPTSTITGNYPVLAVQNFLLNQSNVLGTTYDERYEALFNGGLKIVTNFDPTMQAEAQAAVLADTPANSGGFIEGLASIDPTNGAVRALVGGPPNIEFDTMTQGLRQPGSGFKLFTLLAALQEGYSVYDTVDSESPCAIRFPGSIALLSKPIDNDTGPGGGTISLVTATAQSVNCAYIRLAHEVGLSNVLAMAYKLGISQTDVPLSDQYDPAVVIGAGAVPPIELAGAYAAIADQGVFHPPSVIDYIDDRTGNQIYKGLQPGTQVVSPQIAAEADIALRAVVTSGTGTSASLYNRPVAGKTGTTSNNVDAWFNGFTPQLETTVWMGNLNSDTVPIYIPGFGYVFGANFPAETWHTFMSEALSNQPVLDLPTVNNREMPATKFITSASLVADDVLDHNASGGGCYSSPYSYQSYYGNCPAGGGNTASSSTTVPPAKPGGTTPTTAPKKPPPTTSPPTTAPPTTTPGIGGGAGGGAGGGGGGGGSG